MKLFEEFKLYENLWEPAETSAVVFVCNIHNKNVLLDKVAETNPANITTVFSVQDFLRQYQNANNEFVKFYTDKEGMAELEKSCADMPNELRNQLLRAATLLESADPAEATAIVFVGNKFDKEALLAQVAKTNPTHTTTVYSAADFLRQYQNVNKELVKFYTDAEGKAELEAACADMPGKMKNQILSTAVLVEAAGSRIADWNRQEDWHLHNAPDEAYALMAVSDDSTARNVFISWMSPDYDGYFGAVDNFDDIELYTFYETVADAEDAADGAYNQAEYGFFQGPISIIKISNFRQAYFGHGVAPQYTVVKTV